MNVPILIEHGAYFSRDGFVGDEDPKKIYRTTIFDAKEQFTEAFQTILQIKPSKYYVVILKDTGTDLDILKKEADILFNDFEIKGCAFVNAQTAILFSWAQGPKWHNGLVFDIGYQTTVSAPIVNGKPKKDLCEFSNTAGISIEGYIIKDLKEQGLPMDIIQRNKDNIVDYLTQSHYYFDCQKDDFEFQEINKRKQNLLKFFEIKDEIEGLVRIDLPDPVLPLDLLLKSQNFKGLPLNDCVINVTNNCLNEIGAKNLERIIFCGGGGQILGLRSFLIRQLFKSTNLQKSIKKYEIGIRNVPSECSATSSWLGDSILFSLTYSDNFFLKKQDYNNKKDGAIDFIDEKLSTAIKEQKL